MTLNLLVGAVMVTCALLLHELGHVGMARMLGCRVEGFYFWRGGLAGGPRAAIWTMQKPGWEFGVALAGPLTNVLLAQWVTLPGCPSWTWANWIVGGIAMLPLHGSDGRRAVAALRKQQLGTGGVRRQARAFRCFLRDSGAKSVAWAFGCRHKNLGWPRTEWHRTKTQTWQESYQRCIDCGERIEYTGELVTNQ